MVTVTKFKDKLIKSMNTDLDRFKDPEHPDNEFFSVEDVYNLVNGLYNNLNVENQVITESLSDILQTN